MTERSKRRPLVPAIPPDGTEEVRRRKAEERAREEYAAIATVFAAAKGWRLEVPMPIPSLANARGHWTKTSSAQGKRGLVLALMRQQAMPPLPVTVRLTRVAPRELDSDNNQRALKHARDGVADAYGVDDRDERIVWMYGQERGRPRYQALRIEVSQGQVHCSMCGQPVFSAEERRACR